MNPNFLVGSQKLLEDIKSEKEHLQQQVENLERKTNELEQQLRESEEKLQLVMDYPSIDTKSRPRHADKEVMANGEGEMDVVKDMEQQIMANNIRIMTLEGQNEKLRNSVTLLMVAQEDVSRKKASNVSNIRDWKTSPDVYLQCDWALEMLCLG